MKLHSIALTVLVWLLPCITYTTEALYDPILVAVIMVKNEETVMKRTLQPFVDGGVDAFFVLDTGSTDDTITITQEFFTENHIFHGYIEEEPFIDFATSRNHTLERAKKRFPNAGFMLMLDAEWYLNDAAALVSFCKECLAHNNVLDAYHMRIVSEALDFYTPRLIWCKGSAHFEGVVHEIICCQTHTKVPEHIYFEYQPESLGIEKSNQRYIRDRELLYTQYVKNPYDTRNLFYLARTCEDLGNLEEAYALYKERITLVGWPEEDFMAVYRLAQTIEKLSYTHENYPWHEALYYYLEAYAMRPHRAEPLISIAWYYVHNDEMEKAFLFARRAVEIPYPEQDVLFVQKYAYEYDRYELLARCAWYIQEYEIGEQAAEKAYAAKPQYPHAYHNVCCYRNRLKTAITA